MAQKNLHFNSTLSNLTNIKLYIHIYYNTPFQPQHKMYDF